MGDICGDNRFEIIDKAKEDILKSTNISSSEDEMKVIDNFLFRCWQMGWLDKYIGFERMVKEEDGNYKFLGEVTHWMPIPELPNAK